VQCSDTIDHRHCYATEICEARHVRYNAVDTRRSL